MYILKIYKLYSLINKITNDTNYNNSIPITIEHKMNAKKNIIKNI